MAKPEPCWCEDYQPEDPDDRLCFICECGHVEEEHAEVGFFRPCDFTPAPEPEE